MRRALLLLSLFACNNEDKARHLDGGTDTAPPDIDAALVDAAPLPVKLTVTYNGQPQMNVHVYFQKIDSSVVSATVTDANGIASAMMPPGGYVTAIDPFPLGGQAFGGGLGQNVLTFAGVKPGDQLVLDQDNRGSGASMNLIVPGDPLATSYFVFTPCGTEAPLTPPGGSGSPNATGAVGVFNCGATTDILVVTYDGNGQVLNSLYKPGATVADHDYSAETYTPAQTRTYTYTNTPVTQGNIYVDDNFATGGALWFQKQTIAPFSPTPPTVVTAALPTAAGVTDVMITQDDDVGSSHHLFIDWGPYASTYNADFAARLTPDVTTIPSVDTNAHALTWTESGGALTPDFVQFDINGFRSTDSHAWQWMMAAPHSTKIELPVLPTDVYDFNFKATDSAVLGSLILAKVPGGYDAVRAQILSRTVEGFTVSASGSISTTIATNPGFQRHKPTARRH